MSQQLISINVTLGKYQSFIDNIIKLSKAKVSAYVCVANVHMLVECSKNENYRKVVNNANIITPDGMPLAKSLKLMYGIDQDRVAGMDLLPDLLLESERQNLSVFFYGGDQKLITDSEIYITKTYPNLKVVGYYSPPFRPLTEQEESDIVALINSYSPNLLFVALGCPKQEKWMALMKNKINTCMVGIGGALSVMIGLQTRAPEWMQRNSLEWLYRLAQEPNRLLKRYLVTNTWFIYFLLKEIIKNRHATKR
ncbi:MAG: glycosyl transferase [Sphingobacteriales bacterium]|nr:glycosyl transferase [Sphingobacteriales bacterium]